MRRFWRSGLLLTIACLSPMGGGGIEAAAKAGSVGKPAPAFELVTFAGQAYSRESLKGHPTLLVFWASWCRVCQKELPVLGRFYENERPAQLRVISIGFSDLRGNIENYVTAHPKSFVFPTAFDIDNDIAQAFKVTATPTVVLMDAQGTILLVHRGAGVLQHPKFREFLGTLKGS